MKIFNFKTKNQTLQKQAEEIEKLRMKVQNQECKIKV